MAKITLSSNNENIIAKEFKEKLINAIEIQEQRPVKQNYKPSSMNCIRKMYFIMKGYEPSFNDTTYQLVGICESGTDRHLRLQKYIKDSGFCEYLSVPQYIKENNLDYLKILRETEYETHLFDTRYKLSFMLDGLIKFKNKIYILEIKTESSNKFYTRNDINNEHRNQISCYSLALQVNEVIFIYENRDVLDKKVFHIEITQDMRDNITNLINDCEEYLKNNIIPKIPKGVNCSFCDYRKYCK